MERSNDWLTLTLKPDRNNKLSGEENYGHALGILRVTLHLAELIDEMEHKGRARYYAERLEYNDVNIKFADPENFNTQGVCIEFSGNGLKFFEEYLASYGYDLRMWCSKWRALAIRDWATKCTRFDVAMDDKRYNGDRPALTMRKVLDSVCDDEFVTKFRCISSDCGDQVRLKQNYRRRGGNCLLGDTVYFGHRKSKTCVRFYDKLIEQQQNKKAAPLPESLTSWTRCEFEYHDESAMAVFNAFVDYNEKEFGEFICENALNQVRFINRVVMDTSRCPVKRWWKEFLNGCTKRRALPKLAPVRSELARAIRGINQYIAILATFKAAYGNEALIDYIDSSAELIEAKGGNAIKQGILNNIRDGRRRYELMNGWKNWYYASELSEEQLKKNIEDQRWIFSQQDYRIYRAPEDWGGRQARIIGAFGNGM